MKFLFPRDTRFSAITNGNCSYYYNDAFNERTTGEEGGKQEVALTVEARIETERKIAFNGKANYFNYFEPHTGRIYPDNYIAGVDIRGSGIYSALFTAEKVLIETSLKSRSRIRIFFPPTHWGRLSPA